MQRQAVPRMEEIRLCINLIVLGLHVLPLLKRTSPKVLIIFLVKPSLHKVQLHFRDPQHFRPMVNIAPQALERVRQSAIGEPRNAIDAEGARKLEVLGDEVVLFLPICVHYLSACRVYADFYLFAALWVVEREFDGFDAFAQLFYTPIVIFEWIFFLVHFIWLLLFDQLNIVVIVLLEQMLLNKIIDHI